MKYIMQYEKDVVRKDIPALPKDIKIRAKKAVEEKLTSDPISFGKPLRRSLKNYRKLRIGDYRVIFRVDKEIVRIFAILHRSVAYEIIKKRT